MGPDANEPNDYQATATFLGSGSTLQIQNASDLPQQHRVPRRPRPTRTTTGSWRRRPARSTSRSTSSSIPRALLPAGGQLESAGPRRRRETSIASAAGHVRGPGRDGQRPRADPGRGRAELLPARLRRPPADRWSTATTPRSSTRRRPCPTTSSLSRSVLTATVTSGGSGYTSAPTVTFTGGGGTGAGRRLRNISQRPGDVASPSPTARATPRAPDRHHHRRRRHQGPPPPRQSPTRATCRPDAANDDSGRSQFDNVTNINTPTIYIRLADGVLLNDLPGNGTTNNPPAGVIPIPYSTVGNHARFPRGHFRRHQYADPRGLRHARWCRRFPGLYQYTFTTALADGVHNIVAEVQMVDPATPTETGFGAQSTALQITVDTVPPPVCLRHAGRRQRRDSPPAATAG